MFSFAFPHFARQLKRTTTIPPALTHNANSGSAAPYVSFDAIIGHNSAFHMLTADELDELGGVEYRALNALLWIVGFVSLNPREAYIALTNEVTVSFRLANNGFHHDRTVHFCVKVGSGFHSTPAQALISGTLVSMQVSRIIEWYTLFPL
jgi:hypothetical protein